MKTTQEKTQAVRAKIHELVPEILEPKLGCRLTSLGYSIQTINDRRGTGEGGVFKVWTTSGICLIGDTYKPQEGLRRNAFGAEGDERWEILGRPITLADLLKTIDECGIRWVLSPFGIKYWNPDSTGVREILIPYQYDETFEWHVEKMPHVIEALHSLLFPGEGE